MKRFICVFTVLLGFGISAVAAEETDEAEDLEESKVTAEIPLMKQPAVDSDLWKMFSGNCCLCIP